MNEVNAAVNAKALDTAKKMLLGGEQLAKVVEYTDLTPENIKSLAEKLGVKVMH